MTQVVVAGTANGEDSAINALIDHDTRALVTMDVSHSKIHNGDHFFYRDASTVSTTGSADYILTTPSDKEIHHITNVDAIGTFTYYVYEDTEVSGSTVQTVLNRNRNSTKTSGVTLKKSVLSGSTLGTRLYPYSTGYSQGNAQFGGNDRSSNEIILKKNANYLFRVNSGIASNLINILLDFYIADEE